MGRAAASGLVALVLAVSLAPAPSAVATGPDGLATGPDGLATGPDAIADAHQPPAWRPGAARLVPGSGPSAGGTTVRIAGRGFDRLHVVRFGSTSACVVAVDETGFTVIAPAGEPGRVRVTVEHPVWGTDTVASSPFRYVSSSSAPPVVERLLRTGGLPSGGDEVYIDGRGFCRDPDAEVLFGDRPSPQVEVVSDTRLRAVAPAHEPAVVPVVVRAAGVSSRSTPAMAYGYRDVPTGATRARLGVARAGPAVPDLGERGTGWASCGRESARPGCPGSLSEPRYLHTAVTLDRPGCAGSGGDPEYPCGQVLLAGGQQQHCHGSCTQVLESVERFEPATGRWRRTAPLAVARGEHTLTLLEDGSVLAVGGHGPGDESVLSMTDVYDPVGETWVPAHPLRQARFAHTATRLGGPGCAGGQRAPWCGHVLVAGGVRAELGRPALAGAEQFDPATGRWSDVADMATARTDHTATLLPSGEVLVAGGLTRAVGSARPAGAMPVAPGSGSIPDRSPGAGASAEIFDPTTGRWPPSTGASATAEILDPVTGRWRPTGSMAVARFSHTATLMADGRVLVVGGIRSGDDGPLASAEVYDPATGTWSPAGIPGTGRSGHVAVALSGGRVLVAGGGAPFATAGVESDGWVSPSEASVEVYDPGRDRWEDAGSLRYPRAAGDAVVLDGPSCRAGRPPAWCRAVMVTGGAIGVGDGDPGRDYLVGAQRGLITGAAYDPLVLATSELWACARPWCAPASAAAEGDEPPSLVLVVTVGGLVGGLAAWIAVRRRPRRRSRPDSPAPAEPPAAKARAWPARAGS